MQAGCPCYYSGEGVTDLASVLITGASGMIGMYLTSALLKKKHRVFGVDIKSNEFIGADPNYTFVQCDANDKDRIVDTIKSNSIDTIVHLAYTALLQDDLMVGDAPTDEILGMSALGGRFFQ